MPKLFKPITLGKHALQHRVVMAPLTRMRASETGTPRPIFITYYSQRASKGGLIISEATNISKQGTARACTPGIYNQEQVEAWKPVIKGVHEKGGIIFCQLWHTGRASDANFHPQLPNLAPSAIKLSNRGEQDMPKAMTKEDIKMVIGEYEHAARLAKLAGFDGVEIHGANGYLLDQFLSDSVNHRDDEYGGSIENKCRIVLEVVDRVCKVWDSQSVGIRFSPCGTFNEIVHSQPIKLFSYLLEELSKRNLAYVHLVEPRIAGGWDSDEPNNTSMVKLLRPYYKGIIIAAGGFKRDSGIEIVENGHADLVAYGRYFISNPDLPYRLKNNLPLNPYNRSTFYTSTEEGYTDYPFYNEEQNKL